MATAQWKWAAQTHILRPEEPIYPVRYDVRASWNDPSHFDLATILWTVWPDLNNIRFRLIELTDTYCVESTRDTLILLVRPSRWELTSQACIVAVEVVRLQWSSIISRAMAHLMTRRLTPRELVRQCRIRDCSVFPCEIRLKGDVVPPDTVLGFQNGDLVTVLVRDGLGPNRFLAQDIAFEAGWDSWRWRSQEQVFASDGNVLVFRTTTLLELSNTRVSIPSERWHTWDILLRRAAQHWQEHDLQDTQLFRAHPYWKQCEEFQDHVEIGIISPIHRRRELRTVIFVCRDTVIKDLFMWAQIVEPISNEHDVIDHCDRITQCQHPEIICNAYWNGRPLRFIENVLVNHGDIFTLEVQPRDAFCIPSHRHSMHFSPQATDSLALLQLHATKGKSISPQIFERSPVTGLPPPGNPAPSTGEEHSDKQAVPARPIPTPCRAYRTGLPIRLFDHLSIGSDKAGRIPVRTAAALAGVLDFDPVAEALLSDWENLTSLHQDTRDWIISTPKLDYVYWDPFDAHTVHVFTDGSAGGNQAGWAFVIQADTLQETLLVGYQRGSFANPPWHERMGPPTAYNAEIQALTAATWWMLRFMRALGWQGQIHFHWDSTVAGGKAVGAYWSGDPGSELLRSLQLALESSLAPGKVHHSHVKAHAGHHTNETADAAAKRAAQEATQYSDGGMLASLLTREVVAPEWLWYALQQTQGSIPKWNLEQGCLEVSAYSTPVRDWQKVAEEMIPTGTAKATSAGSREHQVQIATYNALSISQADLEPGATEFVGRVELMRKTAETLGLHILGIQEARTKQGQIISSTHVRFCSGAERGIAWRWQLRLPYRSEGHTERCFRPTDFVVAFATPRELFVSCTAPGFECILKHLTTCKRRLRHIKQMYVHILLKGAFDVWSNRTWQEGQLRWVTRLLLAKARLAKETTQTARQLRKELRAERTQFLDTLVKEAAQMNVSEVFFALRNILPNRKTKNASRPLPQVKQLDGSLTTTKEELERRWNEHFSELEAGRTVALHDIIHQAIDRQSTQGKPQFQLMSELPTRQSLETAFRRVRTRRAPGPDHLPSELLAIAPAEMARIFYPLLLKLSFRLEEPIQWKGGTLIALHKGKGPHNECASFRGI